MSEANERVCFVVMPFLPEHQPALGVSSLKSVLARHGIGSDVRYFNLEYRERIGWYLYFFISRGLPSEYLLGEMVFGPALWGRAAKPWDEYERRLRADLPKFARQMAQGLDKEAASNAQTQAWEKMTQDVRRLYEESASVIAGWARRLLETRPRVVAFTSTFQQNVASLALARALREAASEDVTILFGGANCEAEMGAALADNFPFIDHVVSGEGEEVIVELVRGALDGASGPAGDGRRQPRFITGPVVREMDTLPVPDFDDYFAAVRGTDLDGKANLAAESSRGCWWGAKSHCTFCGLNGTTMSFRRKMPETFAREMRTLVRRHGDRYFMMADNILDMGYIATLFPELIAEGDEIRMFYETKSNLRKEQLELMAAGGIWKIQPGIESLSTPILRLMGKGTTRLQNIQLLKWCEEFGMLVKWNLLFGFPGENPDEYDRIVGLMPSLVHLPPPSGSVQIRLDRFSPYWRSPSVHGIENVRRYWAYDLTYSELRPSQRERLAYFFEFDYQDGRIPEQYGRFTIDAANRWLAAYGRRATLELTSADGEFYVVDTRRDDDPRVERITGVERRLLAVLDSVQGRQRALEALNRGACTGERLEETDFDEIVDRFKERRWITEEENRLLSLVVDRTERERLANRRVSLQMAHLGLPFFEETHKDLADGVSA